MRIFYPGIFENSGCAHGAGWVFRTGQGARKGRCGMVFGHWTQTGVDIWLTLIGMAVVGLVLLYVVRRKT